jgi:2-polyprenyl-6-methoxyphenol hydroxylase-like FAD-dependent oxidoreductase
MLSLSVEVSVLSRALRVYLAPLAIAGLSAAVGLAMSGHKVRVLERATRLEKAPGGIRLPPNVTKILVQWGLEEEIAKRGSIVQEGTNLYDCKLFFSSLDTSVRFSRPLSFY